MSRSEFLKVTGYAWFTTMFYKGDNFCDFLLSFKQTNPLLKKKPTHREQIVSLETVFACPESLSIPPNQRPSRKHAYIILTPLNPTFIL